MDDDRFIVHAEGRLLTNGLWQIDAQLRFREGIRPEPGDLLLGQGRLAVHQAILTEAGRGRVHGATAVRVRLEDQGQPYEFELREEDVPLSS